MFPTTADPDAPFVAIEHGGRQHIVTLPQFNFLCSIDTAARGIAHTAYLIQRWGLWCGVEADGTVRAINMFTGDVLYQTQAIAAHSTLCRLDPYDTIGVVSVDGLIILNRHTGSVSHQMSHIVEWHPITCSTFALARCDNSEFVIISKRGVRPVRISRPSMLDTLICVCNIDDRHIAASTQKHGLLVVDTATGDIRGRLSDVLLYDLAFLKRKSCIIAIGSPPRDRGRSVLLAIDIESLLCRTVSNNFPDGRENARGVLCDAGRFALFDNGYMIESDTGHVSEVRLRK